MSAGRGVRHTRAVPASLSRNDDLGSCSAKPLTTRRSRNYTLACTARLQEPEDTSVTAKERYGLCASLQLGNAAATSSSPTTPDDCCVALKGEKRNRNVAYSQEVDSKEFKLKKPRYLFSNEKASFLISNEVDPTNYKIKKSRFLFPNDVESKDIKLKKPRFFPSMEAEDEKIRLRRSLTDRLPTSGSPENDLEAQFKRAIRLYRYMSLSDTESNVPRPVYRPFLKRNLIYMRLPKNAKNSGGDENPTLGWEVSASKQKHEYRGSMKKRKEMEHRVKREHMDRLVEGIKERKKPKMEVSSEADAGLSLAHSQSSRASALANGVAGDTGKQLAPAHITSMISFIDVRNKDLPGSRHATIIVYMATEIDGVFGEIRRLPSATVTMQVNDRSKVNVIDFPQSVGSLRRRGRDLTEPHCRNDYVIIRVTFSGEEDAKISGGRTLRCVPSRQAEKAEVKITRRSCGSARRKTSPEETLTMLGARCISSSTSENSDGIICGYGAINLVPEKLLPPNAFPHDRTITKKIVELGKKMHMGPFVRMCISQESNGETSSSDDETSRCSSRSTSDNSDDDTASEHTEVNRLLEEPSASTAACGYSDMLRECSKHELSLSFPPKICYRFIMRENQEPNTSFPESKLPAIPDDPPYVASFLATPNGTDNMINTRSIKTENGSSLPLKEVSRLLNGHVRSHLQNAQPKIASSVKCTLGSPLKLRLDAPRRDSLSETIDLYAGRFESCSALSYPRTIARDDKVTVPELHYTNYPEPDGNGVVTRFLSPSNKCFFCHGTFLDMFALLLHLRTSYPRLDIVYRGDVRGAPIANSTAPVCVDVFVRDHFDGSFEGPVSRQYLNSRNRLAPQRCAPNDRLTYLVWKSMSRAVRGMRKDLSVFFTKSDREKRAAVERNPAFYGFRSHLPHYPLSSQVAPKQIDQEWLREFTIRQIDDFLDLSRVEKDFMAMWNIFLLNVNHKPLGRCHVYRTCRLFVAKHREDLLQKEMRTAWLLHLTALHEKEALNTDEVYDLIMRAQANYNPVEDVCHVVYTTRRRLEAAAASSSAKRDPPVWQREPVVGPKMSVLRSASMAHLPSAELSLDNEDMLKKFIIDDPANDERRSSSGSGEEPTRHCVGRRQRETDCTKYLVSPRASQQPKWLSFAK